MEDSSTQTPSPGEVGRFVLEHLKNQIHANIILIKKYNLKFWVLMTQSLADDWNESWIVSCTSLDPYGTLIMDVLLTKEALLRFPAALPVNLCR